VLSRAFRGQRRAKPAQLSADEPGSLSGADLGREFGRTDRWGRKQIEAARSAPDAPGLPPGTEEPPPASRRNGARPTDTTEASTGNQTPLPPTTTEAVDEPVVRDVVPATDRVRTAIRWVTTAAVIVVAACAARASYDHQRHVVEMAGEDQAAWYLPLSVDGMMLVASLNMLVRRWDHHPAGHLTWAALLLGGTASLAANVAAADPTVVGRVVAAWPPACLIVSYELHLQQLPNRSHSLAIARPSVLTSRPQGNASHESSHQGGSTPRGRGIGAQGYRRRDGGLPRVLPDLLPEANG